MKQKLYNHLILTISTVLLLTSLPSCVPVLLDAFVLNPYQFYLNEDQDTLSAISLYNMGTLNQFYRTGNNAFELQEEGKVAMGFYKDTQHYLDITLRPSVFDKKSAEISFHTRCVSENYKKGYGIECRFTENGFVVSEGGTIFFANPDVKLEAGQQYRFRLINDGKYIYAYLDCDVLFTKKTKLPLTEQFVIEHRKGTSALYEGVYFKRVDSDIDPLIRGRDSFDYEEFLEDLKGIIN